MNWPLPTEFNEAVQTPSLVFADPDLKAGTPVVGATGLPLPRAGNFADVYQIRGADGRDWAVKCFTRPVTGLDERYQKVGEALAAAKLPFTVRFQFLADGIRVRGEKRPAVKMEWVDGLLLNQFVRDNAAKPAALDALLVIWVRMCRKLRELGIAHADLQHGNVLLVAGSRPGAFGVKLIDYDGMYVPALAARPSGEAGHPCYQHPGRATGRVYSPDLDRFPHLVIATALRGVAVLGPKLWEKYDTGDNLLFTEADFKNPAGSAVMRDLWDAGDRGLAALVGSLAAACGRPIPQTPWLDHLAPDGVPMPLGPGPHKQAVDALGLPETAAQIEPFGREEVVEAVPIPESLPEDELEALAPVAAGPRAEPKRRAPPPAKSANKLPMVVGGLLVAVGAVIGIVAFGGKKSDDTAQVPSRGDPAPEPKGETPKPTEPAKNAEKKARPKSDTKMPETVPPVVVPKLVPPTAPVGDGNFDPVGAPNLSVQWAAETKSLVRQVRFGPDGKTVVAVESIIPLIHVLSAADGGKVRDVELHTERPVVVVPFSQGMMLSTSPTEPEFRIWHPTRPQVNGNFRAPPELVGVAGGYILETSPDEFRYLVVGRPAADDAAEASAGGQLRVLDSQWKQAVLTARSVLTVPIHRPKCAVTADGRLLVADTDRLRWFRLPEASQEGEFPLHGTPGKRKVLAVSPDGSRVLFTATGTTVAVLDGRTGNTVANLPDRFRGFLAAAAFSPDGSLLAMVAESRPPDDPKTCRLELLDVPSGKVLGRLALNTHNLFEVGALTFSAEGTTLAVGRDKLVQLVSVPGAAAAKPPAKVPGVAVAPPPAAPAAVTLTPRWARPIPPVSPEWNRVAVTRDGRIVVVGSANQPGPLATFDTQTGNPGPTHPGYRTPSGLWLDAIGSGAEVAACGYRDAAMTTWDARAGKTVGKIRLPDLAEKTTDGPTMYLNKASPDGKFALRARQPHIRGAAVEPAPFRLIDGRSGKSILSFNWTGGSTFFTADSARVLVLERSGHGRWFRLPGGTADGDWRLGEADRVGGSEPGIALSADGTLLLCHGNAAGPNTFYTVDTTKGLIARAFVGHGSFFRACGDLTPDGRYAVLASSFNGTGKLTVLDTATGAVAATAMMGGPPLANGLLRVTVSPDGRTVVAVTRPGHVEAFTLTVPGGGRG
jgi:WD40 repeat protein